MNNTVSKKQVTKTLTVLNDPGHGWCKVKRSELDKLGLLDKITGFSYERGDYVYLEEDLDMSLYMNKLRELNPDIKFKFNESHTNNSSKIRTYASFENISKEEFEEIKRLRETLLKLNFSDRSIRIIKSANLSKLKKLAETYL